MNLPVSPAARRVARTILNGFESYFAEYQNITLGAKRRFESANWQAVHRASTERIDLYKNKVLHVARLVDEVTSQDLSSLELWRDARAAYAQLVSNHANYEIAETFFNSIFCRILEHWQIHDRYIFVLPSRPLENKPLPDYSIYVRYEIDNGLVDLVTRILDDFCFSIPWENRRRDISHIVGVLRDQLLPALDCPLTDVRVEMLESVFYRNKAAYLVGRVSHEGRVIPIILPCLNNEKGGIYVDTLIHDQDGASIIFSFTRSYFMVDAPIPSRFVRFLLSLMPQKSIAELYNSIGFNKHGKTEFYRDIIRHMKQSDDQYVIAPGIKGMVMTVFTLPSYGVVFKVIKDRFDPPKQVTEEIVRDKYRFVSRSDRAGRMADTQEYSNFIFYRNRFSEELIEELQRVAPSKLWMDEKWIIIRHLYVERRMEPLNLYLRHASAEEVQDAMDEYGNAIKQMAAANIFPRRHAAEELRRDAPWARGVLRLRRDLSAHRVQFPPDPATAQRGRRVVQRAVVHGGGERCVPGGIPPVLLRQPAGAQRLRITARGPVRLSLLAAPAGGDQRRFRFRHFPVPAPSAFCARRRRRGHHLRYGHSRRRYPRLARCSAAVAMQPHRAPWRGGDARAAAVRYSRWAVRVP
jgi:isocitrate dehydrogenase kinase/phosphatase